MNHKEAQWIRLNQISKMAADILTQDIINKKQLKQLDIEVSAMLRHLSSTKKFFKRLS